jgi:predicted aminopeptidase
MLNQKCLKVIIVMSNLLLLSACSQFNYYAQSINGHFELMGKQEKIINLIEANNVSPTRKKQLKQLTEVRKFASESLDLPENNSYTRFVELGRAAVTWNVVATPRYSMTPKQWKFPVVGQLGYKGFFKKEAAEAEARALQSQGYEVFVVESSAYSTLGWFDDPVVSPMLSQGLLPAIETMFHELAHQRLYFPGDTAFNEAFATAVAQEGVKHWLRWKSPQKVAKYEEYLQKRAQFLTLLLSTNNDLQKLYAQGLEQRIMEVRKQVIYARMNKEYTRLKLSWHGDNRYDDWFDKPVNNARLALVGMYHQRVAFFVALLSRCEQDFSCLYRTLDDLIDYSPEERVTFLERNAL